PKLRTALVVWLAVAAAGLLVLPAALGFWSPPPRANVALTGRPVTLVPRAPAVQDQGPAVLKIKVDGPVDSVALSPDGKFLASVNRGPENDQGRYTDHELHLWDPRTGKLLRSVAKAQDWFYAVTFSPDGKTVAGVLSHREN